MSISEHDGIEIRRATEADEPAVLHLLQASLGWVPNEQYARFFAWKHRENPFGRSAEWVALDRETVVGYRTFLRWQFMRDGAPVPVVRAVDTATHPDYQGRRIFSRLTLHALAELRAEGVAFVFNTPNDQSRPGYLKMGWQSVGRPQVLARPVSLLAAGKLLRSRVPAERWSLQTEVGLSAAKVLTEADEIAPLLATLPTPAPGTLATHRTHEYLAWRYRFEALGYRVLLSGDRIGDGFAVFRLRRRGRAVEAAIVEALVPGGDGRSRAALLRRVAGTSGADYAMSLSNPGGGVRGFVSVPGQGPTLVWRSVCETVMPPLSTWDLALSDVELF